MIDWSQPGANVPTCFSAKVQCTWCATERVKDLCGGGPLVDKETKQKKRASGLDLFRPKSSKGRGRASTSASELQPASTYPSNSPFTPPLPPSGLPIAGVLTTSRRAVSNGQDRPTEPRRLGDLDPHHERLEAWQVVQGPEARDGLVHRDHSGKLPAIRTDLPYSARTIQSPPPRSPHRDGDSERVHWMSGRAEIEMLGSGGCSGGDFKVFVDGGSQATIYHFLASIALATRPQDFNQFGICVPWDICDVQLVHSSVFARHHVLSLRLIGASTTLPNDGPNVDRTESSSSADRARRRRSNTPSLPGVFGIRPRGKTITGEPPTSYQAADPMPSTSRGSSDPSGTEAPTHVVPPDLVTDKTVFLCFSTDAESKDWFSLLRTFCRWRTPDEPSVHRRLAISIFDLAETQRSEDHHARSAADGDKTTEKWSKLSRSETRATTGYAGDSVLGKKVRALKPGWSDKDKLALEIMLDGVVVARSTWSRAADHGVSPFWGETFALSDLAAFTTCSIAVYRQAKGKAALVATVELPLVSDFSRSKDERYPVKSIVDGIVVAEIRLSVSYQEVSVLPVDRYRVIELAGPSRIEAMYNFDDHGNLDGVYDGLARIGLATGSLFELLSEMADREAATSEKTLFRSNTPLSKLLESTIRLLSQDFLIRSIGPTIARLALCSSTSGTILSSDNTPIQEELVKVSELVEACWADMYAARGCLPESLKRCLSAVFWAVKRHHPDSTELYLPYKAISSFLFLRLINPAIMRPHLFNLRQGLWSTGQQRTATLVAKVISSMSFFSPRDSQRDPELALFGDLIKGNSEMMLDYLSTFTIETTSPTRLARGQSPVTAFVRERVAMLPSSQAEAVPRSTAAGPIDLQAEAAVLSAMLHARRTPTYVRQAASPNGRDSQIDPALDELDANLKEIHGDPSIDPPSPTESAIMTPEYQLPLPHSARRPTTPERRSPDSRAFPIPPSPFGITREKSQRQRRDLTEAVIVRSLSGRGVSRRGSMPRLRIRPVGVEADDPARPSTARR